MGRGRQTKNHVVLITQPRQALVYQDSRSFLVLLEPVGWSFEQKRMRGSVLFSHEQLQGSRTVTVSRGLPNHGSPLCRSEKAERVCFQYRSRSKTVSDQLRSTLTILLLSLHHKKDALMLSATLSPTPVDNASLLSQFHSQTAVKSSPLLAYQTFLP